MDLLDAETQSAPLRQNRNFRLLWIGQVLSNLGSEFGAIAYPLLILTLTGSPVIAGAVGTVTAAAAFFVRLPAGSLADPVATVLAVVLKGLRNAERDAATEPA